MKIKIYNLFKIAFIISIITVLNSCETQEETSFAFSDVSAPSNLNVLIEMTDPDTNEISVTLSGENASTFDVYFGDVDEEVPTVVSPGETVTKTYSEEGEYILKAIAKTVTGATSELSRTITIGATDVVVEPVDPVEGPQEAAPSPALDEANVISLFSDVYTNVSVDTFRTDWSDATLEETTVVDDNVLKYSDVSFLGIETVASQIDASQMTHIHLDVWTDDAETFGIKLVDFGADAAFDGGDDSEHEIIFDSLTLSEWNSFDIPLSDFIGLDSTSNLAQYILVATPSGAATVYVDNIYFYSESVSVQLPQLPVDMESSEITYEWSGFGEINFGPIPASVISNPDSSGINISNNVVEIEKLEAAWTWAGASLQLDGAIDFSNSTTVKLNSWSPRAGIPIRFKIEDTNSPPNGDGNPSVFVELDALTTVANTWETLIYDLATVDGFDASIPYNRIVIFPDFGTSGMGETFYFDDIELEGSEDGNADNELITNGDFEAENANWIVGVDDAVLVTSIVTENDNSYFSLNVETAGNVFDVNMSQKLEIVPDTTYTLTFDAWSDVDRTIVAGIGLSGDPWSNTSETITLSTTPTTFTLTLVSADFGAPDARVLFDIGGEVGLVNIDNVSLTR